MSWYNSLSDLTGDIGSVAKNPLVEAGLGALTGGAAIPALAGLAGGALSKGGNLGTALEGGLMGGLAGIGGSKIPGVSSISGLFGGGGSAPTAVDSAIPDSALGIPSVASIAGGAQTPSGTTGGQGFLSSLGNFLGGNGGKNALNTAQALNEALLERKSNQLANSALSGMQASYNQRAPLRAVGIQSMQNAQAANPFASY